MFKIETGKNNPILRRIADKINDRDFKKTIKLGKEMIKYIKNPDNGGVGLAAPQIGKGIKLVVINLINDWDNENFKTIMMINPEILEYSQETNIDTEGCLSIPGITGKVKRSSKIKVTFQDEKNIRKTFILEGLNARIVQHEYDHLIGKLFIDYLN